MTRSSENSVSIHGGKRTVWDEARDALNRFRETMEHLGPEFSAVAAISYSTMSVAASSSTEPLSVGVALQMLVSILENLKQHHGWSSEQIVAIIMSMLQNVIPQHDESDSTHTLS